MSQIFADAIYSVIPILSNPVSLLYLGLAAIHVIVVRCYLKHQDGRPLAICAGMTSTLYVVLAFVHGLAN